MDHVGNSGGRSRNRRGSGVGVTLNDRQRLRLHTLGQQAQLRQLLFQLVAFVFQLAQFIANICHVQGL